MRTLRSLAAAAALTAVLAPAAHAYTCMPHVYEHTATVAGQTVTYYTVQIIC